MFVMFRRDTAEQFESYGDALNARLASDETETNVSDEDGNCSTQADLEDLAARKIAVKKSGASSSETTTAVRISDSWLISSTLETSQRSIVASSR
jgi:hypothetical protein